MSKEEAREIVCFYDVLRRRGSRSLRAIEYS